MRKMVFVVVLGVVGVATSGGAVALPNDDAGAADSIAETVERLSPSVAVDLEPVVVSGGVVSTEVDDVLYVFEPSGEISISSSDAGAADAVVVGLPTDLGADSMEVATDGSLAYLASDDEGVDLSVRALVDGSLQVAVLIPVPDAPHEFTFPLDVPEGTRLVKGDDGGVLALSATDDLVLGVGAPWARDAAGGVVETEFRIDGQSIIQSVHYDGDDYPLVADPWLGLKLVDRVTHAGTGTSIVYSVYPTAWGRGVAGFIARDAAFNEAKAHYPWGFGKPQIRDQFYCHYDMRPTTTFKSSWNLEIWRPDVGLVKTVLARCNP